MKIHKLSIHEAQKIAAGEVVDRPANVVKELIENAIDAGATTITLYVEDGGKQLIRIVDNGSGMDESDAAFCFEHHTTSKIKSVDDLNTITTFGFRGEALSSIAAVSNVTLITKESTSLIGTKVELVAGTLEFQEPCSANTGTDITISSLFFNVPARKKFLKTKETEWNAIQQLFYAYCLDHLHIHFKLFAENKSILNCPATADIAQRITQLWEHNFANNMIPLSTKNKDDSINIHGIISNHHYARYDRNNIFFFVNRRWVKQQKLSSALLKGYMNVIQPGRYPAACIFIDVPPHEVDINIHPRKEEVQFLHPRRVEQLLQQAVKNALEHNVSLQLKKNITFAPATEVIHRTHNITNGLSFEPMYKPTFSVKQQTTGSTAPFNFDAPAFNEDESLTAPGATKLDVAEFTQDTHTQQTLHATSHEGSAVQVHEHYTFLGQFNKTYLLLEKEDGLYIVDQHAAHERILYELFSKRFEDIATVPLLFPQIITLRTEDLQALEPHLQVFAQHGIGIEQFSDTQLVIKSTPVHLKNQSLEDLVHEAIGAIAEQQNIDSGQFFKSLHEKIRAQMACKAAVKAGDTLSHELVEQLLEDLYKTPNRFTCPHGRPTGWLLSTYEIEKKFKRKL